MSTDAIIAPDEGIALAPLAQPNGDVLQQDPDAPPATEGEQFRAPPPPSSAPPARMTAAAARARAMEQQAALEEDFGQYLNLLDSEGVLHKVTVRREEPEFSADGRRIKGYLGEFNRPITAKDIQQRWGPGVYRVTVSGPVVPGSSKHQIKWSKLVDIADMPGAPKDDKDAHDGKVALVRDAIAKTDEVAARQEAVIQKLIDENRALRQDMVKAMTAKPATDSSMVEMMRLEVQRIEAQRIADEARREAAEREKDRRHEKDLADLKEQRESDRREAERKHEREMATLAAQREKDRQEMAQQAQRDMQLLQQVKGQGGDNLQAVVAIMQQNTQQLFAQLQAGTQQMLQSSAQLDQIKLAGIADMFSKRDDLAEIRKWRQISEIFVPKAAGDEETELQQITTFVKEAVPGIVQAASSLTGGNRQAQPQAAPATPPMLGPAPGSVIVAPVAPMGAQAMPRRRRLLRSPVVAPEEAPARNQSPHAPASDALDPNAPPFRFPAATDGPDVAIRLLGEDLDLALRKAWPARWTFRDVVLRFPPEVISQVQAVGAEKAVEVLCEQAPKDSPLQTLRGAKFVEQLYELMEEHQQRGTS